MKRNWIDNLIVSAMSIIFVALFVLVPVSVSSFNTSQSLHEQYSLIDIFFQISNKDISSEHPFEKAGRDVIIVDISDIQDRTGLADAIQKVKSAHPLAIGLDVGLTERKEPETDQRLSTLLVSDSQVISPCAILTDSDGTEYIEYQFYSTPSSTNIAAVNMDEMGFSRTCRTFSPIIYAGSMPIPTFAAKLAEVAAPDSYSRLKSRGKEIEYINYNSSAYSIINALLLDDFSYLCENKVVIIGDTTDPSDRFTTPLAYHVSGAEIHAMAVDTILSGNYINVMSTPLAWIMAFLVVLLVMPVLNLGKRFDWLRILIPLFQALFVVIVVYLIYMVFRHTGYYINVIYTALALGFVDVCDNLYVKIKNTLLKRK